MAAKRPKRGKIEDASDADPMSKKIKIDSDDDEDLNMPKRSIEDSPASSILNKLINIPGLNGLKNLVGNRSSNHEKPAELFRKDLISAMKLADTEQLQSEDYFCISDPWRQEWEKGVQVPVNPQCIPNANIIENKSNELMHGSYGFKLPKKVLHAMDDDQFKQGIHELHETHKLADNVCRYDLDDLDVSWLTRVNEEREAMGDESIEEWVMEKIMEELESQCHENMQTMIRTVDGLGIEYDENVVCDVCRSPESEDSNEMVFCDACDICVHQACYGIQTIPEGSWLCRICALGIKPKCILCPKTGGAMKSTKSGTKWAHVNCALWIPEVSIGCAEKMEPITKISNIPSSRWALICSICREKEGACIQCSVKTCKTAFHVTCAVSHQLEMKTILEEDAEDVVLKALCQKHTNSRKNGGETPKRDDSLLESPGSPGSPTKAVEDMTEEEKTELRSHRLEKLAEEFFNCAKAKEVANALKYPEEMVDFVFAYWVLKRKSNFNKPLLTPKTEEADLLSKQREDSLIARMKMFVHLRQDLERVRNLCYMVGKREKMRRQLYRMKEHVFYKQVKVMDNIEQDQKEHSATRDLTSVVEAHKISGAMYDKYDQIIHMAKLDMQHEAGEGSITEERKLLTLDSLPKKGKPGRPRLLSKNKVKDTVVTEDKPIVNKETAEPVSPETGQIEKETVEIKIEPEDKQTPEVEIEAKITRRSSKNGVKSFDTPSVKGIETSGESKVLSLRSKDSPNVQNKDISLESETAKENDPKDAHSIEKGRTPSRKNGFHPIERELKETRRLSERTLKRNEVNGLINTEQLIVKESIKQKVQNRLYKSRISRAMNEVKSVGQKRIENLFRACNGDQLDNREPNSLSRTSSRINSNHQSVITELPPQARVRGGRLSDSHLVSSPPRSSFPTCRSPKNAQSPKTFKGESTPTMKDDISKEAELAGIPETRSARRRIESDMESNSSDRFFESIDGEISIRSSRDTTPDRDHHGSTRRCLHRANNLGKTAAQRHIIKRLNMEVASYPSSSDTSDEDMSIDNDSDSVTNYSISERSFSTRRRTRSRTFDQVEVGSVESGTSSGVSTRSKLTHNPIL